VEELHEFLERVDVFPVVKEKERTEPLLSPKTKLRSLPMLQNP
jgi:hypothetical protein